MQVDFPIEFHLKHPFASGSFSLDIEISRNLTILLQSFLEIINKSGSWFSYEGTKLGQGRDAVKTLLKDNPDLMETLEAKLKEII